MNILVIGGTRFFGINMVESLIEKGHNVTLATRGKTKDDFGQKVERIRFNLFDYRSCEILNNQKYDTVIDKITYSSNEIKAVLENIKCNRFIHMSTANVYESFHFGIDESEFDANYGDYSWCDRMSTTYEENKISTGSSFFKRTD